MVGQRLDAKSNLCPSPVQSPSNVRPKKGRVEDLSRHCPGTVLAPSNLCPVLKLLDTHWTGKSRDCPKPVHYNSNNPEIVQSLSTTIENCAILHPGQTLDRLRTWEIGAQGSYFGFLKKDIATLMLHWTEIGQTFDMDAPWTEFGHLIKYSNCYQVAHLEPTCGPPGAHLGPT